MVGPIETNCYVVTCPETRETVVIDPGGYDAPLAEYIEDEKLPVKYIINTPSHFDQKWILTIKISNYKPHRPSVDFRQMIPAKTLTIGTNLLILILLLMVSPALGDDVTAPSYWDAIFELGYDPETGRVSDLPDRLRLAHTMKRPGWTG